MTIQHTDSTGKPWTFEIDCTPIQGRMFERLLLCVRTIGNREALSLSYMEKYESNTGFRAVMEHVVLSALKEWTYTAAAKPEPLTPEVSTTTTAPPPPPSGDDDDDKPPKYYWQRDNF